MQKVNFRTQYAVKRAKVLSERRRALEEWRQFKNENAQVLFARSKFTEYLKASKQASKEDWEMGMLAPKRNAGKDAEKYGTMHQSVFNGSGAITKLGKFEKPWTGTGRFATVKRHKKEGWKPMPVNTAERTRQYEEWMASEGWKKLKTYDEREESKTLAYWLKPDYSKVGNEFRRGDNVVITQGHNVGVVGEVAEVDQDKDAVTLKDVISAEYYMPEWMRQSDGNPDADPIQRYRVPQHPANLRLVHEIHNQHVVVQKMWLERNWLPHKNKYDVVRYLPGLRTRIDPKSNEDSDDPKEMPEDEPHTESDTLRLTSEVVNFVPSLIAVPMPPSVLDELRGRTSKYRTRHDPEYIAKKQAEDEAADRTRGTIREMRTPLMEVNRMIAGEVKAVMDQRKETEGSTESIGRKIWEMMQARETAARAPATARS